MTRSWTSTPEYSQAHALVLAQAAEHKPHLGGGGGARGPGGGMPQPFGGGMPQPGWNPYAAYGAYVIPKPSTLKLDLHPHP